MGKEKKRNGKRFETHIIFISFHFIFCRSAVYLQFTNEQWKACTDPLSGAVCVDSTDGTDVLEGLKRIFPLLSTTSTYWTDLLIMFGIGLVWLLFGIVVASYKANQSSKIHHHSPTDGGSTKAGRRTLTLRGQVIIVEEANTTDS